ncbi:unnamed protein product [Camellia sinensis]
MAMIPSIFGGRRSNVFDPFSLDIWDPFEGFPFNSALANAPDSAARETSAIANTRIDWKETQEAHIFKVDLPGLKKEEVKVEVEEGRVLQISGERNKEHEEKNDKWHRIERSSGKFLRRFRLPENVKMDEVKATMEDGVLTVIVPKEEEKKPEVKSIDISVQASLVVFDSPKASSENGEGTPRRALYVRGTILGYKRSKSNQYPNTSLIQIEGVNTKEEVDWYRGKRMAYIYKAKVKKNGSQYRCIWGKVSRPHGNSGVVRAKFKSNLPPRSMGARVRVFMYPSNI